MMFLDEREERVFEFFVSAHDDFTEEEPTRPLGSFFLLLLFWKAIHHAATEPDVRTAVEKIDGMGFFVPESANLDLLKEQRTEEGNAQRIAAALEAMESNNPSVLPGVLTPLGLSEDDVSPEADKRLGLLLNALTTSTNDLRQILQERGLAGVSDIFGALLAYYAETGALPDGIALTPPVVGYLIAQLTAIQSNELIYDPCCGAGSLLHAAVADPGTGAATRNVYCCGQDPNRHAVSLACLKLLLGRHLRTDIRDGGPIDKPAFVDTSGALRQFDVVLSRPPFTVNNWPHEAADHDAYGRFSRGTPPRHRGNYAYILHMIESMRPDTGRMAVIVPHGVLFRREHEAWIRRQLIEENLLDVVIGLPDRLFIDVRLPTAIMVFRRDKTDNNVLFVDASRIADSDRAGNRLTVGETEEVLELCRRRASIDGIAHLASPEEIRANDFNCNLPLYIGPRAGEEVVETAALRTEHAALADRLEVLREDIDEQLDTLWD